MLTLTRLDELAALNDPKQTAAALREYVEALPEHDQRNLVAMAELKPAADLVEMSKAAPEESEAVFVRVAAIIRHASDSLGELRKAADEIDVAAMLAKLVEVAEFTPGAEPVAPLEVAPAEVIPAQTSEPVAPVGIQAAEPYAELYSLPVFSLVGDRGVYDTVAKMQKGRPLKASITSGWFVPGTKPAENHYVADDVVARMVERALVVPALSCKPGKEPGEYNLSAVGWRCMGCLYTDKTAGIELRVYELLGKPTDTATAKRWRSITADYRARQARKDVAPAWGRYAEFPVALSDKITQCGIQTVTVIFEPGDNNGPDCFEFYGECLNEKGYFQHCRSKGTVGKTVTQLAYDLAAEAASTFAEGKKEVERADAARARAAKVKPPEPPLRIIDDGEDAAALAAELGIL